MTADAQMHFYLLWWVKRFISLTLVLKEEICLVCTYVHMVHFLLYGHAFMYSPSIHFQVALHIHLSCRVLQINRLSQMQQAILLWLSLQINSPNFCYVMLNWFHMENTQTLQRKCPHQTKRFKPQTFTVRFTAYICSTVFSEAVCMTCQISELWTKVLLPFSWGHGDE